MAMELAICSGAGIGFMTETDAASHGNMVQIAQPRDEWRAPLWLVTHVDLHRTSKVQAGARENASLFHRSNPITQLSTYGPMWMAGRMMKGFIHSRNDWLYGHDVTLG